MRAMWPSVSALCTKAGDRPMRRGAPLSGRHAAPGPAVQPGHDSRLLAGHIAAGERCHLHDERGPPRGHPLGHRKGDARVEIGVLGDAHHDPAGVQGARHELGAVSTRWGAHDNRVRSLALAGSPSMALTTTVGLPPAERTVASLRADGNDAPPRPDSPDASTRAPSCAAPSLGPAPTGRGPWCSRWAGRAPLWRARQHDSRRARSGLEKGACPRGRCGRARGDCAPRAGSRCASCQRWRWAWGLSFWCLRLRSALSGVAFLVWTGSLGGEVLDGHPQRATAHAGDIQACAAGAGWRPTAATARRPRRRPHRRRPGR